MNIRVKSACLQGQVPAIASKSHAHRLLIAAALSDNPTQIPCAPTSQDIEATARCLAAMGCGIVREGDVYGVTPGPMAPGANLDCGESGSTLRFLLPILPALGMDARIHMAGRLPVRPLSPLREVLLGHGATLSPQGENPLRTGGCLSGGAYRLPGNVSSQFISGLLLALPLLAEDSTLTLTSPPESSGYITMTRRTTECFGVRADFDGQTFSIPGRQAYRSPGRIAAEGDWSNAAFWLCAGALSGGPVTVTGLDTTSAQGDRAIVPLLQAFGAAVHVQGADITVSGGALRGLSIDAREIPDLAPVLAVVGAAAAGTTRIYGAGRLRLKESDRLMSTAALLRAVGADASHTEDALVVRGGRPLHGGEVSAFGDHRISMAAAVLGGLCERPITILGAQACAKSYPGFFADFARLGGETEAC